MIALVGLAVFALISWDLRFRSPMLRSAAARR